MLIALGLVLSTPGAAAAGPAACTCRNLESLQQDYQNAVYLEGYMRRLAEHLKAIEAPLIEARRTAPDSYEAGVMISSRTDPARAAFEAQNLHLPFDHVAGYTGPDRVSMPRGTCAQLQADLDALENGSPCEAMADVALAHELFHRDNCNRLGADAYWSRLDSEIALEEADAYHAQAANLKAELRRVLDASQVTYHGRWPLTVTVPGAMNVGYLFVTRSDDLGQSSSGDTWAMTGKGSTTVTIEQAEIGGMACSGSGSVDSEFQVTMTTDGLTFGLDLVGTVTGGNPALSCPGGGGMGFPPPDPVLGQVASGQPLHAGDNQVGGDWGAPMRAVLAGMGQVTGDADIVLSVTCEGQ